MSRQRGANRAAGGSDRGSSEPTSRPAHRQHRRRAPGSGGQPPRRARAVRAPAAPWPGLPRPRRSSWLPTPDGPRLSSPSHKRTAPRGHRRARWRMRPGRRSHGRRRRCCRRPVGPAARLYRPPWRGPRYRPRLPGPEPARPRRRPAGWPPPSAGSPSGTRSWARRAWAMAVPGSPSRSASRERSKAS